MTGRGGSRGLGRRILTSPRGQDSAPGLGPQGDNGKVKSPGFSLTRENLQDDGTMVDENEEWTTAVNMITKQEAYVRDAKVWSLFT